MFSTPVICGLYLAELSSVQKAKAGMNQIVQNYALASREPVSLTQNLLSGKRGSRLMLYMELPLQTIWKLQLSTESARVL